MSDRITNLTALLGRLTPFRRRQPAEGLSPFRVVTEDDVRSQLLTVTSGTTVVRADPRRVALFIAVRQAAIVEVTAVVKGTLTGGIVLNSTNPVLRLNLEHDRSLVQCEWIGADITGVPVPNNTYVLEVFRVR